MSVKSCSQAKQNWIEKKFKASKNQRSYSKLRVSALAIPEIFVLERDNRDLHRSFRRSLGLLFALDVSGCEQHNVISVITQRFQTDEQLNTESANFHGERRTGLDGQTDRKHREKKQVGGIKSDIRQILAGDYERV